MNVEPSGISSSSTEEVTTSDAPKNNAVSSNTSSAQIASSTTTNSSYSALFGVVKGKIVQPFVTRTKLINNPGSVPPVIPPVVPYRPPVHTHSESKFKYVKPGLDPAPIPYKIQTPTSLIYKKPITTPDASHENQHKSGDTVLTHANNVSKPTSKPLTEIDKQKLELERKQQELNAVIALNKKKLIAATAAKQNAYAYQNENLCIVNKYKKPTVIAPANTPSPAALKQSAAASQAPSSTVPSPSIKTSSGPTTAPTSASVFPPAASSMLEIPTEANVPQEYCVPPVITSQIPPRLPGPPPRMHPGGPRFMRPPHLHIRPPPPHFLHRPPLHQDLGQPPVNLPPPTNLPPPPVQNLHPLSNEFLPPPNEFIPPPPTNQPPPFTHQLPPPNIQGPPPGVHLPPPNQWRPQGTPMVRPPFHGPPMVPPPGPPLGPPGIQGPPPQGFHGPPHGPPPLHHMGGPPPHHLGPPPPDFRQPPPGMQLPPLGIPPPNMSENFPLPGSFTHPPPESGHAYPPRNRSRSLSPYLRRRHSYSRSRSRSPGRRFVRSPIRRSSRSPRRSPIRYRARSGSRSRSRSPYAYNRPLGKRPRSSSRDRNTMRYRKRRSFTPPSPRRRFIRRSRSRSPIPPPGVRKRLSRSPPRDGNVTVTAKFTRLRDDKSAGEQEEDIVDKDKAAVNKPITHEESTGEEPLKPEVTQKPTSDEKPREKVAVGLEDEEVDYEEDDEEEESEDVLNLEDDDDLESMLKKMEEGLDESLQRKQRALGAKKLRERKKKLSSSDAKPDIPAEKTSTETVTDSKPKDSLDNKSATAFKSIGEKSAELSRARSRSPMRRRRSRSPRYSRSDNRREVPGFGRFGSRGGRGRDYRSWGDRGDRYPRRGRYDPRDPRDKDEGERDPRDKSRSPDRRPRDENEAPRDNRDISDNRDRPPPPPVDAKQGDVPPEDNTDRPAHVDNRRNRRFDDRSRHPDDRDHFDDRNRYPDERPERSDRERSNRFPDDRDRFGDRNDRFREKDRMDERNRFDDKDRNDRFKNRIDDRDRPDDKDRNDRFKDRIDGRDRLDDRDRNDRFKDRIDDRDRPDGNDRFKDRIDDRDRNDRFKDRLDDRDRPDDKERNDRFKDRMGDRMGDRFDERDRWNRRGDGKIDRGNLDARGHNENRVNMEQKSNVDGRNQPPPPKQKSPTPEPLDPVLQARKKKFQSNEPVEPVSKRIRLRHSPVKSEETKTSHTPPGTPPRQDYEDEPLPAKTSKRIVLLTDGKKTLSPEDIQPLLERKTSISSDKPEPQLPVETKAEVLPAVELPVETKEKKKKKKRRSTTTDDDDNVDDVFKELDAVLKDNFDDIKFNIDDEDELDSEEDSKPYHPPKPKALSPKPKKAPSPIPVLPSKETKSSFQESKIEEKTSVRDKVYATEAQTTNRPSRKKIILEAEAKEDRVSFKLKGSAMNSDPRIATKPDKSKEATKDDILRKTKKNIIKKKHSQEPIASQLEPLLPYEDDEEPDDLREQLSRRRAERAQAPISSLKAVSPISPTPKSKAEASASRIVKSALLDMIKPKKSRVTSRKQSPVMDSLEKKAQQAAQDLKEMLRSQDHVESSRRVLIIKKSKRQESSEEEERVSEPEPYSSEEEREMRHSKKKKKKDKKEKKDIRSRIGSKKI